MLIRRERSDFQHDSFLDDRILGPNVRGAWVPIAKALSALVAAKNLRPLHFIFHTGHVGSTLVSRLLDDCGALLPLREPLALRTLADAYDVQDTAEALVDSDRLDEILRAFIGGWSRGYDSTIAVILKATSSAGRVAPVLLRRAPTTRALYINLAAEPYLATLLAGANSVLDLRGHGPARIRRLNRRLSGPVGPLHALEPGELAAMSWLCETLAQQDCLRAFPERTLGVDFDRFLTDVPGALKQFWRHFELPGAPRIDSTRIAAVLSRYSKAPELEYSPALRYQLLNETRSKHGAQITKGLEWLRRLADREPQVGPLRNLYGF